MISDAIKSAFKKRKERKWDKMYWCIDVHDTILKGEYSSNQTYNPSPDAIEILEWLTKREDMVIIIWTSSYGPDYDNLHSWFLDNTNIKFNYFNHNPECGDTDYAQFNEKFYFKILLDDKAGFVESDWKVIKETLIELGEW